MVGESCCQHDTGTGVSPPAVLVCSPTSLAQIPGGGPVNTRATGQAGSLESRATLHTLRGREGSGWGTLPSFVERWEELTLALHHKVPWYGHACAARVGAQARPSHTVLTPVPSLLLRWTMPSSRWTAQRPPSTCMSSTRTGGGAETHTSECSPG